MTEEETLIPLIADKPIQKEARLNRNERVRLVLAFLCIILELVVVESLVYLVFSQYLL